MKKSVIAWAAALTLALALTGCAADRPVNSAGMNGGGNSAVNSDDPARGSAGIGNGDSRESARPTPDVNDAEDGGGAGGTNDVDNDGKPESDAQARAYDRVHGGIDDEGRIVDNGNTANNGSSRSNGSAGNNGSIGNNAGGPNSGDGVIMDDVGRAAGDMARGIDNGIGSAARGVGNAIRNAGDAVGSAVTGR